MYPVSILFGLGSAGTNLAFDRNKSVSSEYSAASTMNIAADLIAAAISAHRMWTRPPGNAVRPTSDADLILATLALVEILELATGFGPPYEGDDFKTGSSMFIRASEQLNSALPDDRWQGLASRTYADRGTALQTLAQQVAALDQQMADIIKSAADSVTHIRLGFGILKNLLLVAFRYELALLAQGPAGAAAAWAFAVKTALAGFATSAGLLTTLTIIANDNGDKVNDVTAEYDKLRNGSGVGGTTLVPTDIPAAVESTVPDFSALRRGMSGMSGIPTIATLARLAPEADSPAHRALLANLGGAQETRWDDMSGETPETVTPPTAFTPPGLGSLNQNGGQTANLLPHVSIANQTPGQPQQPTSVGRQGQQAQARTEEANFAEEASGAGAANGSQGAERAPIEVAAADASQLNRRGRGERIA